MARGGFAPADERVLGFLAVAACALGVSAAVLVLVGT